VGLPAGGGAGVTELFHAFLLVIVGLSGDAEHAELFNKWGTAMATAAKNVGVPADRVLRLGDESTKVDVEKAFATVAGKATADDVIFVVLIGHGSYDGHVAKFNLKGPDMSAADFGALLKKMPSRHVVFVNTTSASGPFLQELAGPDHTIVTATRTGAEQYDTVFPGYFIDAFNSEAADADKNHRVTLKEAFDYAQREVARAYEREGLLATEHAMMDDGGKLASVFALGTAGLGELPLDPKLRALYIERRELEQRVEALKVLKASMDPAKYESELEALVTALARKSREIRQTEAPK
jgi:hypothetical protein